MEATLNERNELKEGLRRLSTGLGLMMAATALPLMIHYSPMPFLDMRVTGWITIILDCIALGFFIPGLLRLTAAPEALEIRGVALLVLGGVVLEPLARVMEQLLFMVRLFEMDLSIIWLVAGLAESAGYVGMAYMLWRIELDGAPATEPFKAPPLFLAAAGAAAACGLLRVVRMLNILPIFGIISLAYLALFVMLFIIVRNQRTRLDTAV